MGGGGAPVWPCHPVGPLHGWATLPCSRLGGTRGPPAPEDAVGASCPPAAAGGRHVAAGTFLLPRGCRLSLVFVHPPAGPPCLFPPPHSIRRIAGAAAANSSPRPHLGNIWARGGCPLPRGLSGGRMLPGGAHGVPKAPGAGGMNEVVAWATAPEPGGLPRAAGSCAGGRRHGGGGVERGSPPGCAHPAPHPCHLGTLERGGRGNRPPAVCIGWARKWAGGGGRHPVVAGTCGVGGCHPTSVGPGTCWDGGQHLAGVVAVALLGWWPPPCWSAAHDLLGWVQHLTGMVATTHVGCCP